MATIQKPVGLKCNGFGNDTGDVFVIQQLLNKFIMPGCLPPLAPLMLDGKCGNKTVEAIYAFQNGIMGWKKPDMRIDPGGATLAALNGPLKWANKPAEDPVNYMDTPSAPDDDIPKLTAERFKFRTSESIDIGVTKYGISSGTIYLDDLWADKTYAVSFAGLGLGASVIPSSIMPFGASFSTTDMPCEGGVYGSPFRTAEVVELDDITGWCLIYQGQLAAIYNGTSVTVMFLSMGAGLVGGFVASLTGLGVVAAPAAMVYSCRGVVWIKGANRGIPNLAVSGALGYLSFGDARSKVQQIKNLIGL